MLQSTSQYKKKLNGWLSYAFASEVFVIVSLTLFLPICLEQFARDNGFLMPDKTEPCGAVKSVPANASAEDIAALGEEVRCVVKIGWMWIDSASFSLYVYSISVALQALTVISMGGIADHPPHRKLLLLSFALLGAAAATTFLALPSSSPIWWLSAFLAMCANVGFGASVVAMNAYLPSLAKEAPEVQAALKALEDSRETDEENTFPQSAEREVDHDSEGSDSSTAPLIPSSSPSSSSPSPKLKTEYENTLSRTTSRISSLGIALGYGAGIFGLILALIPVTKMGGSTFALRLAIGLSGVWWAVFTIPAAIWLPGASPRDGNSNWERTEAKWNTRREIVKAWVRLRDMLRWREIQKLRNTFKFLAAWFLLSDGFTTITSTAILFGKTTLHMSPSSLILIGVLTPTSGIVGSLVWPVIQRKMGWSNLRVLITLVLLASFIPVYGCLGFVFQGRTKFGGLTTQSEMWGLAVYFGSVYGAFQGYARAFYAELLPPGEEARWYGLFSITDKSSSFLGPLIVGLISDTTGNIRYGFFVLIVMIWAAVPILLSVDVERGRQDAREYTIDGERGRDTPSSTTGNGVHI
ncbi:MFS general substrate transporter [Crucibulum laeve]|uniref:Autophagy-related protein n=1 Tax=Crucibulum laeve TaxID=68775 RepID=A0A5C3LZU7_9AGAR|nr:MFS general substrate transporter [Crucibulum laeve]